MDSRMTKLNRRSSEVNLSLGKLSMKRLGRKYVSGITRLIPYWFRAEKGHAPEIIAHNPLPGGWNMVVMNVLEIDHGTLPRRLGSDDTSVRWLF